MTDPSASDLQRCGILPAMGRALALLLGFGAVVGTLLDAFHTFSGTTAYTHPVVFSTAWWAPLLFASAYGFGGVLYASGFARLGGRRPIAGPTTLAAGLLVFAAIYALSAWSPPHAKLVVVSACALGAFLAFDRTRVGFLLGLVSAFLGPLAEVLLIRAGMFRHLAPDVLGVPFWLPALYFSAGPTFGAFARHVVAHTSAAREMGGSALAQGLPGAAH